MMNIKYEMRLVETRVITLLFIITLMFLLILLVIILETGNHLLERLLKEEMAMFKKTVKVFGEVILAFGINMVSGVILA
jgi:hypothetical protein